MNFPILCAPVRTYYGGDYCVVFQSTEQVNCTALLVAARLSIGVVERSQIESFLAGLVMDRLSGPGRAGSTLLKSDGPGRAVKFEM